MAAISVTDSATVEVVSANPHLESGFGKYLPDKVVQFVAGADVIAQFRRDLTHVDGGDRGIALEVARDIPLKSDGVVLNVGVGLSAILSVFNRTGMLLFEKTFIGPEETVPAGTAYVAFTLKPTVTAGVAGGSGRLRFGITSGTEMTLSCYRPFDLTAGPETLAGATRTLFEHFAIPADAADLADLAAQPVGTISAISGHSQLQIAVSAKVSPAFNPLASTAAIPKIGKVELSAPASISAGVKAAVIGEFQIRVRALGGNRIRLSYHKMAARRLDVALDASAGLGVNVAGKELLAMMFGGDTTVAGPSEEQLAQSGISSDQLEKILSVLNKGLSRKLAVEVGAAFSRLKQNDTAFMYDIDVPALDAAGKTAVSAALAGDLSRLNDLESSLPGHGITLIQSRLTDLRKKSIRWRINLVGIVNVVHMSAMTREGSVFHDEESGDVVVTDKTTTERLGAVTNARKLRKLLYQTGLLTVTYKASGLDVNAGLAAAQTFVFFDNHANRQRVADYLDAVAAVGLMDPDDIESQLGAIDDFGPASLLIETTFDQRACEQMFLDGGEPRTENFFQTIGRQALLSLVKERDPDAFRRIPVRSDVLWQRMLSDGNTFKGILPPPITGGPDEPVKLAVVQGDFMLITWWAKTMAIAAERLAEMRAVLKKQNAADFAENPAFVKARKKLESAMADSLGRSRSDFGDPWGLVALFNASLGAATATATVISEPLQIAV